jgi:hypothetical protein
MAAAATGIGLALVAAVAVLVLQSFSRDVAPAWVDEASLRALAPFTRAAAEERGCRGGTSAIEPIDASTRPAGAPLDFSMVCYSRARTIRRCWAPCAASRPSAALAVRIVTLFTVQPSSTRPPL